ncbi:MAG: ATP-binding protein [Candidatus Nomurabacteria bacterium]|nr:ATP-binding protein [Candidatus Nomurabacteria bacterium]
MKQFSPFDKNKFIGYVSKVTPELTKIHFPNSKLLKKFYYDGDVLHSGIVRSYVVIEGEGYGFLGKVISIELPEKERMFLSEASFQNTDLHPVGTIEIQLSFKIFEKLKAQKGLDQYPPVGAKVYACSLDFLKNFLEDFGKEDDEIDDLIEIASLPQDESTNIKISANSLFSRHCAIVGTTGGGKSYTVAKTIEELLKKKKIIKMVLIDSTGEFSELDQINSFYFGKNGSIYLDYINLTESDLFALFRPSGQTQVPVLQKAIKSLKLARALESKKDTGVSFYKDGFIIKTGNKKEQFNLKYNENLEIIESENANFDIQKLPTQILNECIYEDGGTYNSKDPSVWGGESPGQKEYAASLIMRISAKINNSDFSYAFGLSDTTRINKSSLEAIFCEFHGNTTGKLLKIDLSYIGFEENLREILGNCIGRFFLQHSQKQDSKFKIQPVLLFLDEAHKVFRVEKIKDEYSNEFKLDAFERIAKECRKFGLFLCLSTQRPRDIPQGVLSQMGAFIAHRLINSSDRESIENASPEGSKYLLSFLPSLGKGEAILMGVDFPMPINIKVGKVLDSNRPNSDTPKLFKN